MTFPAWADMTDQEKFEFLNQWCENLSRNLELRGQEIQGLHQRLKRAEDALAVARKTD